MYYKNVYQGRFLERPNRFIAYVEIGTNREVVHVKNTGRCKELLIPGATVYVQKAEGSSRKTEWDLIGVKKGERIINIDSQAPNKVVEEWIEAGHLFSDISLIKKEVVYKKSRFDLYVESNNRKILIEVKGVTLEENGIVTFPDAPSERAVKHVKELCEAVEEGYEAIIFFVIQMKHAIYFTPNCQMHPAFYDTLVRAVQAGVKIMAYDCEVENNYLKINEEVTVKLEFCDYAKTDMI